MSVLEKFQKRKDFLICIDSDGCAIDSMNIKHVQCFGPCMVREWGLEEWEDAVLKLWNKINLYSKTRGINRFLALAETLKEADRNFIRIQGIQEFSIWCGQTTELSNQSVEKKYQDCGKQIFQKALRWSMAVNKAIAGLNEEQICPFEGAPEGIRRAYQNADVAIVSSANEEAVKREWNRYGLMDSVDICLTQSQGSKAHCIGKMIEKGYARDRVLMIGDAPGDRLAAEENGVLYYPILVCREAESWHRFVGEALPYFLKGIYQGGYQEERKQEFEENLS